MWSCLLCVPDLLAGRDLVFGPSEALPQGGVTSPGQALQDLLLHLVQVLHHLPKQTLLRAHQHLNHLHTRTFQELSPTHKTHTETGPMGRDDTL